MYSASRVRGKACARKGHTKKVAKGTIGGGHRHPSLKEPDLCDRERPKKILGKNRASFQKPRVLHLGDLGGQLFSKGARKKEEEPAITCSLAGVCTKREVARPRVGASYKQKATLGGVFRKKKDGGKRKPSNCGKKFRLGVLIGQGGVVSYEGGKPTRQRKGGQHVSRGVVIKGEVAIAYA